MSLVFDPGTEQWIPYARLKSKELEERRKDLRLPRLVRAFIMDDKGTMIRIVRTEFGEMIRITGVSFALTSAFHYNVVYPQNPDVPQGETAFCNNFAAPAGFNFAAIPFTPDFRTVTGITLSNSSNPNVTSVRATPIANTCTLRKQSGTAVGIQEARAAKHTKELVTKLLTAQEGGLVAALTAGPSTSSVVVETKNADGGTSFETFVAVPCNNTAQFTTSSYTPWPYLEGDTPWIAMVPVRRGQNTVVGSTFPGVLSPGAVVASLPFGYNLTGSQVVEAYAFLMPLSEYLNAAQEEAGAPLVFKAGTISNSGSLTFAGYEGRTFTITYTPFVAGTKSAVFATALDGPSETAITGTITGVLSKDETQIIGATVNYFIGKNVAGARKGIICPSAVVVNWGKACLGPNWARDGFAQALFTSGYAANDPIDFYYESIPMGSWGIRAFFARPTYPVSGSWPIADDSGMYRVTFSNKKAVAVALPFLGSETLALLNGELTTGPDRSIKTSELGGTVEAGTYTNFYVGMINAVTTLNGAAWTPGISLSSVLRPVTYKLSDDPTGAMVPYEAHVFRRYGFAWQRFFADGAGNQNVSYPHHKIQDYDFGTGTDSGDGGTQSYRNFASADAWWTGPSTTSGPYPGSPSSFLFQSVITPCDAPTHRIIFSVRSVAGGNYGSGEQYQFPIAFWDLPVFPFQGRKIPSLSARRATPMAAAFLPRITAGGTDGFALIRIMQPGPTVVPRIKAEADFATYKNFKTQENAFNALTAIVQDPLNNPFTTAYDAAITNFTAALAALKVNAYTAGKPDPAKIPLFYPSLKAPFQAVYATYYEVAFNNFASTDVFDVMLPGNVLVLVR